MIGTIVAGLYGVGVPPVTSSYESIATVTVGSGGQSTIEFNPIPSTYKQLQIRAIARGTRSAIDVSLSMRLNGETGSFYSSHHLGGDGANAYAYSTSSSTSIDVNDIFAATSTASSFSVLVMDILDYTDTNKFTTTRGLLGSDRNGAGKLELNSGLYQKTTAISSISFFLGANDFAQHTQFALYGIKD
jgi:hypothetical protein